MSIPLLSVPKPFDGLSLWSGSAVAKAEVNRQGLQDRCLDGHSLDGL